VPEIESARIDMLQQAQLRRKLSAAAGAPLIMATIACDETLAFARRADSGSISQQGPVTPDHIIRTKRVPMLGRDVGAYASDYKDYFNRHAPSAKEPKTLLDAAPRVVLDPEFGLGCVGRTAKDARIVHDLYSHTIDVILRAQALGGYRALPERDIFDVEYWDLEQAKLKKAGAPPVFAGEVALVTGAASGIGRACVEALLRRGAAVIGLDINAEVTRLMDRRERRAVLLEQALHLLAHHLGIDDGLREVVERSGLERGDRILRAAVRRDHRDGQVEPLLVDVLDDLEAGSIGQPHVGEAQVEAVAVEQPDRFADRFRARGVEPHARQRELEQLQQIGLVVDQEDSGLAAGSS